MCHQYFNAVFYVNYILEHTCLFYKQPFFSTQPQCCLTFWWIELQVLLRCCLIHNHHFTDTHFIFSILVSMSMPGPAYVVSMWSILIFSLIFIVINHITSLKQMDLFFVHFLEYLLLFLDDNVNEENE